MPVRVTSFAEGLLQRSRLCPVVTSESDMGSMWREGAQETACEPQKPWAELWMEVHDFVQEAVIKTIPKKKKCKKAKWLSEETLQIAEKRREVKGKGEKERYTHLNAELQRIARRDKKSFLSDQCKEIEENNRMGKTTDLFKKIRDTKGTFHAKMGSVKDSNGMDLTKDIKKQKILRRGGKNTQKNYTKKIFKTQIIMIV